MIRPLRQARSGPPDGRSVKDHFATTTGGGELVGQVIHGHFYLIESKRAVSFGGMCMDRENRNDLEEDLEAGLTGESPETVIALDEEAAAEHGVPGEVEIEDVPLEEHDLLEDEGGE
jgi:hypothetical protein